MKTWIVGFEGSSEDCTGLTYGAAAISDGKYLYNPVTRYRLPISEWTELVKEGHVTAIEPFEYPTEDGYSYYLMRAPTLSMAARYLMDVVGVPGHYLHTWTEGGVRYFLWPSFEKLNEYAKVVAAKLREHANDTFALRDASTLDPWEGLSQTEWIDANLRRSS